MTTISIEQARKRYQRLPTSLQDAIFSVQTAEIISQVCDRNNLPKDKMPAVAQAAGLVLLGFIHAEDLTNEIKERIGVTPQVAIAVTNDLASRMFNPLKSDLDKSYAPVPHEDDHDLGDKGSGPKIIQDISSAPSIMDTKPVGMKPFVPVQFDGVRRQGYRWCEDVDWIPSRQRFTQLPRHDGE